MMTDTPARFHHEISFRTREGFAGDSSAEGRAIDKNGETIDFMLSPRRTAKSARRFLGKALKLREECPPETINTDQNEAYGEAICALKRAGALGKSVQHRQVKYLNNRLEADHGGLKRLINPPRGFKTLPTASATVKPRDRGRAWDWRSNRAS